VQPPRFISGPLIDLRQVSVSDADGLFAAADDSDVMRYMDWPRPKDAAEVEHHLKQAESRWAAGTEFQWAILPAGRDEVVGTISVRPSAYSADFGYFLGRSHWGKGFGRAAADRVLAWCWSQPNLVRVSATADAENARSRRLLERVGLQLEGVMRMCTYRPNIGGAPRDTALYAKCRGCDA